MTGTKGKYLYTLFYQVPGKLRDQVPVHLKQEFSCLPLLQEGLPFRACEDLAGKTGVDRKSVV